MGETTSGSGDDGPPEGQPAAPGHGPDGAAGDEAIQAVTGDAAARRAAWGILQRRGQLLRSEATAWIEDITTELLSLNALLDDLAVDEGTRQRVSDTIGASEVVGLADTIVAVVEELFSQGDPGMPALGGAGGLAHADPISSLAFLSEIPLGLRLQLTALTEDVSRIILSVDEAKGLLVSTTKVYERLRGEQPRELEDEVALEVISGMATLMGLIERLQSAVDTLQAAGPSGPGHATSANEP